MVSFAAHNSMAQTRIPNRIPAQQTTATSHTHRVRPRADRDEPCTCQKAQDLIESVG